MHSAHQHFFRFFLLNKICTKEVATSVHIKLTELPEAPNEDLLNFIESINENIKRYDLELVEGKSEVTGASMIALVQICSSQFTEGKAPEKKASLLFSKLVSKIVLSKCKYLSETSAVNLSSEIDLSKTTAQGFLEMFIQQLWFEEQNGIIYLGPRSILELGSLLSTAYPDNVRGCFLCRNNVFYGKTCLHCHEKIHIYCLQRFFENSETCPSCKNEWAEETMQDDPILSEGPSRSKRPRLLSE